MHPYIRKEVSLNFVCDHNAGSELVMVVASGYDRTALRPTSMIGWKTGELGSPTPKNIPAVRP